MIRKHRIAGVEWKLVDYKTTHSLAEPRVCPPDYRKRLLKTAF